MRKLLNVGLFICLVCLPSLFAQETTLSLGGDVLVTGSGTLYIALFDKNSFDGDKPQLLGLQFVVPGPDAVLLADKRYRIRYNFVGVKKGTYALKAFLDSNGNKKIDIGLFGPTEAWGFSKNTRHAFRGPTFDEVSLVIDKDVNNANFEVR